MTDLSLTENINKEIFCNAIFTSTSLCSDDLRQISSKMLWQYGGVLVIAFGIMFYSFLTWSTASLEKEYNQLSQQQNILEQKLNQYPNMSHIDKLDSYNSLYDYQKTVVKKIISFLYRNGALVSKFIWKEKQLEIHFQVRTPTSYQEFLQIGNLLNKVLSSSFSSATIELEKDMTVQKTDVQIYKYKILI